MNRLSSSTHPHEDSTHERAIEALARESHVPIEQVAQLYEHELTVLTASARVTGFLTILTTRKVREILRQRRHPARASAAPAPQRLFEKPCYEPFLTVRSLCGCGSECAKPCENNKDIFHVATCAHSSGDFSNSL